MIDDKIDEQKGNEWKLRVVNVRRVNSFYITGGRGSGRDGRRMGGQYADERESA